MPEKIRVIIIGDETALVQQFKRKLEAKGFLVGVALTAKDALGSDKPAIGHREVGDTMAREKLRKGVKHRT